MLQRYLKFLYFIFKFQHHDPFTVWCQVCALWKTTTIFYKKLLTFPFILVSLFTIFCHFSWLAALIHLDRRKMYFDSSLSDVDHIKILQTICQPHLGLHICHIQWFVVLEPTQCENDVFFCLPILQQCRHLCCLQWHSLYNTICMSVEDLSPSLTRSRKKTKSCWIPECLDGDKTVETHTTGPMDLHIWSCF